MSQVKVDKYKEEKANRQKIMKKQKLMHKVEMGLIALVAVVFIGWVGYSVYDKAQDKAAETATIEFDNTAVTDYINNLSATE
ncbi:MAG: hypothetical protein U0L12_04150 [Ruminococcus sp.]|nr:hypothetical protein [Ruminococcus sp.]